MRPIQSELLKSVRNRSSRSGLLTADRYFRDIERCFSGGACPAQLFEKARPGDWERSLKDAETRLVWRDRKGQLEFDDREPAGSSPALLEFDAVITTTRRDRDRDVMESAGADVDPDAVLLWQHIPLLPIGRLVAVTEQSASRVKARLAIADTELGRDAATLATFGALRISHGFAPIEYDALPDEGWHFKKFEIYEISLVSVPSNRDAVITAFRRDKLHSPFMKQWAGGLFQNRPVLGRGFTPSRECSCGGSNPARSKTPVTFADTAARFLVAAAGCGTERIGTLRSVGQLLDRIVRNAEAAHELAEARSLASAFCPGEQDND